MSNVLVSGVFDLFHRGHLELLKRARALGDRLVVIVNSDKLTASYKRVPIFSEVDRLAILEACRYVDEALIINTHDVKLIVIEKKINKIVHGTDWERESYLKQIECTEEFLSANRVELVFLPYTSGISTSRLIEKLESMSHCSDFARDSRPAPSQSNSRTAEFLRHWVRGTAPFEP